MFLYLLSAPICQNEFLVGVNLLGNKNNSDSDSDSDSPEQGQNTPSLPPITPNDIEDTISSVIGSVIIQCLPQRVCMFVYQDTYEADPFQKFDLGSCWTSNYNNNSKYME